MVVVKSKLISFIIVFKWSTDTKPPIICIPDEPLPLSCPWYATRYMCFSVCILCFNIKVKRRRKNIWGSSKNCWESWTNRLKAVLKTAPQATQPTWPNKTIIAAAAAPGNVRGHHLWHCCPWKPETSTTTFTKQIDYAQSFLLQVAHFQILASSGSI